MLALPTYPPALESSSECTDYRDISSDELDALLEHWARWASRDPSSIGYPKQSSIQTLLDRLRRELRSTRQQDVWMAPARERVRGAIAKQQTSEIDVEAEAVDAAIQAARREHNRHGDQYGDRLLLTLKLHYGVRDETTPRRSSRKAIAQYLTIDEKTVTRRLATMRQSVLDQLTAANGYLIA